MYISATITRISLGLAHWCGKRSVDDCMVVDMEPCIAQALKVILEELPKEDNENIGDGAVAPLSYRIPVWLGAGRLRFCYR